MAAPMALASIGTSVAGTFLGMKSARQQAQASADLYGYKAMVADLNRKIALQNRDYALQAGGDEAVRYGLGARATMGAIKARQSASGINVNSGSAREVQKGQQYVTGIDNTTIATNTARRAYGYMLDAKREGIQGEMYRKAADDSLKAGKTNVMASLISGAQSVASKWYQASQAGVFSSKFGGGDKLGTDPTYTTYGFGYT